VAVVEEDEHHVVVEVEEVLFP
jgi:hypothetical protein